MRPSGCLSPFASTPIAATRIRSSSMRIPSIWITSRSSLDRSEAIHSCMRAAESATKWREAADFDTPLPAGAGTSPSGNRTARLNLRVDTLISIRFAEPVLVYSLLPAFQWQFFAVEPAYPRPLDYDLASVETD